MLRLGVVSFLNARPLIDGLDANDGVQCVLDVPSALPAGLERGDFDAALIPIVDVLRSAGRFRVVSDACIGCDGETITVRVFARVPPDRIYTLWVDADSHTSVALAVVLWRELFGRQITLRPLDARTEDVDEAEAVLLIGDKVVDPGRGSFGYEVDLGGAWREHTGLPFVFAVWARCAQAGYHEQIGALLSPARDRGVARAAEIAATDGLALGWPVEAARRYLTRCLRHKLDGRAIEGADLFARLCAAGGLVPRGAEIAWPEALRALGAGAAP